MEQKTGRKTDLRVVKTRAAIKRAFKEMVLEMEQPQITVKGLAERAMIHRKTFYLHYTCIEALYEDVLSELMASYAEAMDQLAPDAPFGQVNRVFFTFMAAQEPFMEKIVCDPSYREISDRFFLATLRHNRERFNPYARFTVPEQNIINCFLSISSVNLYRQWVKDGKALPLERLIQLSGQLFSHGIVSVREGEEAAPAASDATGTAATPGVSPAASDAPGAARATSAAPTPDIPAPAGEPVNPVPQH